MKQAWDFACPDWEQRLADGRSLMPDLPLNADLARTAVNIYNKLRLPDVPGTPTLGEASGEWLRDIVRALYGSLVDGERMVPELFCLVPKKNNKTTGGAALLLTGMVMNQRPRAEMIYIAPTHEIADIAFQQTAGMIETDDKGYLQKRFHIRQHVKQIVDRRTKAIARVKTFDMKVVTGSKPSIVLLDELHLMSSIAQASRVIGQIRGGMITNPEAILVMITTQSDEPPSGAFAAELQYARGVRDGRVKNSRMLPILYEFPEAVQNSEEMLWRNPSLWKQVLPNLGLSVHLDRLVRDYEEAREKGAEEERRWASQHLNIEIGLGLHSDQWIGARYWEQAADETLSDFDDFMARCEVIVFGLDGGGLDDLFGLCALGRETGTGRWIAWNRAWCQPDVLERRKDIAEKLTDYANDGDLVICETLTQDIEDIVEIIRKVSNADLLPAKAAIGLDPLGVTTLIDALTEAGITEEQMVAIPQGYRLSGAIWGLERKLKDDTFAHGGTRLMAFCVGNAKCEQRGNAVLITKATAGRAKIDPLIATYNAVQLMSRNPEADALTSPWEDPEFRISA